MPIHNAGPEALFRNQPLSNGRIDCVLDLGPVEIKQRPVKDETLGPKYSKTVYSGGISSANLARR